MKSISAVLLYGYRRGLWISIASFFCSAFLYGGTAHAANVDLTISKAAPSTTVSLSAFNYTISVSNIGNATTGSSTVVDTLPAHLYDLVAASVTPIGSAICPSVADVNTAIPAALRSPATAESGTGQTISIAIPSLPQGGRCDITLSAKASTPGSYINTVNVTPAGSDVDVMPNSNTSNVTTSVTQVSLDLRLTKQRITPSPANFGDTVRYRITFYGDPTISVPNLGTFYPRTFDGWQFVTGTDGGSSGGVPYSSTITSCTTTGGATGCASSPPAVTAVSGSGMSGGQLLSQTKLSLPAGSTLVIEEDVVFTAPTCGGLQVTNLATLTLNANNGSTIISDNNVANNSASASLTLNTVGTCPVATNTLVTTKTLVNPADTVIDTEGEVVGYVIRSTYTSTQVPVAGIRFSDSFQYYNQDGAVASSTGPALTHEIWLMSCSVDALGAGSACPPGPYPRILEGATTSLGRSTSSLGTGSIASGGFVEIRLEERWTGIPALQCLSDRKTVNNLVDVALSMPPGAPYGNFSVPTASAVSASARIDPNVPACIDVASNKSVVPTNPAAGVPTTFNLQFTNNSLAVVGVANDAINVAVTDVLGANFRPTGVTCSVASGNAEAPSVSLANISGPDNTFSTIIPRMDNGASVLCAVTGVVNSPGSYSNTVTANGTAGAGRSGRFDTLAGNNSSTISFGIVAPATLSLTKTLSGDVAGYVTGSTFPVTVSCQVTATAGGATTVVPQTVNLLPNQAQVVSIPPTTGEQTVACTVAEGTPPATVSAGFKYGTPVITPVSFAAPAGGSAPVVVTVDNPLSIVMGSLTVTPSVTGLLEGYDGQPFAVTVSCTGPGVTGFPQSFNLLADASQVVSVPLGAICTISEAQPVARTGYKFEQPIFEAAAVVTIGAENSVKIQNNLIGINAVSPAPVPTLSTNALVVLILLLAAIGIWTKRHSR